MVLIQDSRIHGQKTVKNDFLGLNSMTVRCILKYNVFTFAFGCNAFKLISGSFGKRLSQSFVFLKPFDTKYCSISKASFFYKILV